MKRSVVLPLRSFPARAGIFDRRQKTWPQMTVSRWPVRNARQFEGGRKKEVTA